MRSSAVCVTPSDAGDACVGSGMTAGYAGGRGVSTRRRDQSGMTLVEVLISVVILGGAIQIILGGLWVSIRASRQAERHAKTETLITVIDDEIYRAPVVRCDGTSIDPASYLAAAQSAVASVGWPTSSVTIVDVTFWDGNQFVDECNPASTLNLGQRITIGLTPPGNEPAREFEVVKSDIFPE